MKIRLILLCALFLQACSYGLTEEQCRIGRAESFGYDDGIDGLLITKVEDRVQQCARFELPFDRQGYRIGWLEGNEVFCTPEGALEVGLRGRGDIRACPYADDLTRDAHRIGRQYHSAENELSSADSAYDRLISSINYRRREIDKLVRKLRREDNQEKREEIADELLYERRRLRNEQFDIDDARRRLRNAERNLDRAEFNLIRLRTEMRNRRFESREIAGEGVPAEGTITPPVAAPAPTIEGEEAFPDLMQ